MQRGRRRPIGAEDIAFDGNGNNEQFSFLGGDNQQHTGSKINANHIPLPSALRVLLSATNVGGGLQALFNRIKSFGGAATETESGIAKIAAEADVLAGTDNAKIVTPRGLSKLTATENRKGLIQLASVADLADRTNIDAALTVALIDYLLWPPGSIRMWNLEAIPSGWLEFKGQVLSRENFANLWDAVKAETVSDAQWLAGQFGRYSAGDGATTFRLPDYRGMFPRFADHGRGKDPDAADRTGGDLVGSVQEYATGAPKNDAAPDYYPVGTTTPHRYGFMRMTNVGENRTAADVASAYSGQVTDILAWDAGDNETRPVNAAFMMIVKY